MKLFHVFVGTFFAAILNALTLYAFGIELMLQTVLNSLAAAAIASAISMLAFNRFRAYPGAVAPLTILPLVTTIFMVTAVFFLVTRIPYSRPTLGLGWFYCTLWSLFIAATVTNKQRRHYLFVNPERRNISPFPSAAQVSEVVRPKLPTVRIDGIIVNLADVERDSELSRFICDAMLKRIPVYEEQATRERLTGRTKLVELGHSDLGSLLPEQFTIALKRVADLLVCIMLLPMVVAILAIASVLIKVESSGPVVFRQRRIGLSGKPFTIFKLRTMYDKGDSERFTESGDQRVTRVGGLLRRYRLDELPQIFNVLVGDMSLVGPRPEQEFHVDRYEAEVPFYRYRHTVRPGVTGWAQINQGYTASTEETKIKLEYDLYYIRHLSLWLDLVILQKTIATVFMSQGAK